MTELRGPSVVTINRPLCAFPQYRYEERLSTGLRLVNIYTLSEFDKQKLKDQITGTRGTVQMWIHTHYREDEAHNLARTDEIIRGYLINRSRLIQSSIGN